MRRFSFFASCALAVLLAACVDTSGLSAESTRPARGNVRADVVVTEFADLQCPACRAAHAQILAPLIDQYGNDVRFEFMHFPLRSIHRYALEAAEAAECAADQGKFWEYVDRAYDDQAQLDSDALHRWAQEIGLDVDLFDRCLASHIKRDTVLADYEAGREMEVGGTPTFFVNGVKVQTGVDSIGAAIEERLDAMRVRL